MKKINNENKEFFRESAEMLAVLDDFFYESGARHLFSKKELEKLNYAAKANEINEYAFPVMKPTIDGISEYAIKNFLGKDIPSEAVVSQLVANKFFKRGRNKGNKQDRGLIEILKDNIKEYLENPYSIPHATIKKLQPVKKNANQSKLKQPRVFKLKPMDKLVRPNQETYDSLRVLERAYRVLIKANIEQKIDNKNATPNYADRLYVPIFEEIEAYKNAKALLQKDDDRIRSKATELTQKFESYLTEKRTPLQANVEHASNIGKLTALKGNLKKAVRKYDQISSQLEIANETIENRLVETNPIIEPKGRTK